VDQELADAAAYAPGRCCVCTHQMAAICCVTLRHSHLERMSRLQKKLRQSMGIYLKNNPAKFRPDPI